MTRHSFLDDGTAVNGPTGPGSTRLDPDPRPGDAEAPTWGPPVGAPLAPPGGTVDWWSWQDRVRSHDARGVRPARSRRSGAGLGLLAVVVVAMVGTVAGGAVFLGRGSPTASTPAVSAVRAGVGDPVELLGLEVVPLPEVEATPPPEPAPEPTPPRPTNARFGVNRIEVDFVDSDRVTPPRDDQPEQPQRTLHTIVRVPATRDAGPFPLVVFAHGYAASTAEYGVLLDDLAAAGYVVAAPEFPLTSTALPGAVGDRDAAAQAGDVAFVIGAVQDMARRDARLRGLVDSGPVAVIGHSDGGVTAAGTAFASRVRDPRVGAAVVLSGALGDFGGAWFPPGSPALLAVHGEADDVNPFDSSQSLYDDDLSGSARYLVAIPDSGHLGAFLSSRTRPALVVLIDDFLRASLRSDRVARARIANDASVDGVLRLAGSDTGG